MRLKGVTSEQHKTVLDTVKSGVLDGSVTDADIDEYLNDGSITKNEAVYYKNIDKKIKAEQKEFIKRQKKALELDITQDKFSSDKMNVKIYQTIAAQSFAEKIEDLDPLSKTYRQDVLNAKREAYVEAVEATGRALEEDPWYRSQYVTDFGQRVQEREKAFGTESENTREYEPKSYTSNVDLASGEQPPAKPPYRKNPGPVPGSPFIASPQIAPPLPPLSGPRITKDRLNDILFGK
jgi:hypothetical protein